MMHGGVGCAARSQPIPPDLCSRWTMCLGTIIHLLQSRAGLGLVPGHLAAAGSTPAGPILNRLEVNGVRVTLGASGEHVQTVGELH